MAPAGLERSVQRASSHAGSSFRPLLGDARRRSGKQRVVPTKEETTTAKPNPVSGYVHSVTNRLVRSPFDQTKGCLELRSESEQEGRS
jgi:hypothetical protein